MVSTTIQEVLLLTTSYGEYYNLGGTATYYKVLGCYYKCMLGTTIYVGYYKLWVVTVMYAGYYTLWCVLQFRQGVYGGCYNLVGTTYCKLLYRVAIT